MLQALDEHFPEEVQWTKPDGGLFLMVQLPEGIDATKLLEKAIAQKVAYVPGSDFHTDGSGTNSFRLNYSTANETRIAEGIKRLGAVLKSELVPA
jgi:2-aminoadipate transaminase